MRNPAEDERNTITGKILQEAEEDLDVFINSSIAIFYCTPPHSGISPVAASPPVHREGFLLA
jgi:hypothetical protein